MLFCAFPRIEGAEVFPLARLWIYFARIETVLTGLQFSNHRHLPPPNADFEGKEPHRIRLAHDRRLAAADATSSSMKISYAVLLRPPSEPVTTQSLSPVSYWLLSSGSATLQRSLFPFVHRFSTFFDAFLPYLAMFIPSSSRLLSL
jgi:hypothetical protein